MEVPRVNRRFHLLTILSYFISYLFNDNIKDSLVLYIFCFPVVFSYRTHKHRADALRVFLSRETNLSGMGENLTFSLFSHLINVIQNV